MVRQATDASVTFVVRVRRHGPGHLSGTVERVRTGEKRVFQDGESIGAVIGQMVRGPRQGHRALYFRGWIHGCLVYMWRDLYPACGRGHHRELHQ